MTWTTGDTLAVLLSVPAAMELVCLALCLLGPSLERMMCMERLDRAFKSSVFSGLVLAPCLAALDRGFNESGSAAAPEALWAGLRAVWLCGAVYFGLFRHIREKRLLRRIEGMSRCCDSGELADLKEGMAAWLDVKGGVPVYTGDIIPAPYTRGTLKKRIYLSNAGFTPDELKLLLTHELIHCRQNDCLYRQALLLLRAVFWFCPHVERFTGYAVDVNEMACDERVICERPRGARAPYCRLLVRMREDTWGLLGAYLSGGEDSLEKRLRRLVRVHKEEHPALSALLAAAVVLLVPAATWLTSFLINQYL